MVRRDGPDKLSISELMKSAGLTHGGFYYHFASREDMVARAIERAFVDTQARLEAICAAQPAKAALRTYLEQYLSPGHRDERSTGCPIPILTSYAPLLGAESRQAFEHGAARLTSRLAALMSEAGVTDAGTMAMSIFSEMSGALGISRVIADRARSDEVLRLSLGAVLLRAMPA